MRLVASTFRPGAAASRLGERRAPRRSTCSKLSSTSSSRLSRRYPPSVSSARLAGLLAQPERLRDRRHDQLPVAHRRERDEGRRRPGTVERPAASWSASRVLPVPPVPVSVSRRTSSRASSSRGLGQLALAADERVRLRGQVRGRLSSVFSGGNSPAGPPAQLVEPLRAGEVLEPCSPRSRTSTPVRAARGWSRRRAPGHRGRPPSRGRRGGRRGRRSRRRPPRLAGMDAHPHADLVPVRPFVLDERALAVRGRGGGVAADSNATKNPSPSVPSTVPPWRSNASLSSARWRSSSSG